MNKAAIFEAIVKLNQETTNPSSTLTSGIRKLQSANPLIPLTDLEPLRTFNALCGGPYITIHHNADTSRDFFYLTDEAAVKFGLPKASDALAAFESAWNKQTS